MATGARGRFEMIAEEWNQENLEVSFTISVKSKRSHVKEPWEELVPASVLRAVARRLEDLAKYREDRYAEYALRALVD